MGGGKKTQSRTLGRGLSNQTGHFLLLRNKVWTFNSDEAERNLSSLKTTELFGLQDKAACDEKSEFGFFVEQSTVKGLFVDKGGAPKICLCQLEACEQFIPYHQALFFFMC